MTSITTTCDPLEEIDIERKDINAGSLLRSAKLANIWSGSGKPIAILPLKETSLDFSNS